MAAEPLPRAVGEQHHSIGQRHNSDEEPDGERFTASCALCHVKLRYLESYAARRLVCGPEISGPGRVRSAPFLPEDDVEYDKDRRDDTGPEDRFLPDRLRAIVR